MSTSREHGIALLLMIGATLCWSSAGVLVRSMQVTDAWEITFWRSVFMSISLSGWLWHQHRARVISKIRAVGLAGILSAVLLTITFISFIVALSRTTVANTLIVVSSSPFFAAMAGWLFLRERVALRTWIAMSIAVSGIAVMFIGAVSNDRWIGALIALVVPLAYGLNIALLRRMHAIVDMIPGVLLAGILSAFVTLPLALPFEATVHDLGLLAIMGTVQLGLGCVLMTIASRHLASVEIGLMSILEVLFGTLMTWALVGERPGAAALFGGMMVISALAANQALGLRQPRPVTS